MSEELKHYGIKTSSRLSERIVYSSDVNGPPHYHYMWKKRPFAEAVAWPENEKHLLKIVKLAKKYQVPITPRGGASSYTSGALPSHGGLVVDLKTLNSISWMKKRANANRKSICSVICGAGTIISKIKEKVEKRGFTLPCYPTSFRSATIGGWIADGGKVGFGSYQFGSVLSCLEKIRVVDKAGKIREYSDFDLIKKIAGSCGTSGFIVKVWLKTVPIFQKRSAVVKLPFNKKLSQTIKALQKLPDLWAIRFSNMLSSSAFVDSDHVFVLLTFNAKSSLKQIRKALQVFSSSSSVSVLSNYLAEKEWESVFSAELIQSGGGNVMVTQQYYLHSEKFCEFLGKVENLCKILDLDYVYNAYLDKSKMTRIALSFPTSNLVFEHLLSTKAAIHELNLFVSSMGGHLYSYGKLNSPYWSKFNGKNGQSFSLSKFIARWVKSLKNILSSDPTVFNPCTLKSSRIKYATLGILCKFNYWWRRFAVRLGIQKDRELGISEKNKHHIVLQNTLQLCSRCGYCRENCPAYTHDRNEVYSPLAKYNLFQTRVKYGLAIDEELFESLFRCTSCAQCDAVCPVNCPQTSISEIIRQFVIDYES